MCIRDSTGTASMEKCLLVILIQITIWIVAVILVRILRRYSYGVNIKDTVIIMAAMIMSVIITNEVQMMSTDSDAEKMIVRSIIIMICVTIMFILCVALYEIIPVSYTHLDVYKRQLLSRMLCRLSNTI